MAATAGERARDSRARQLAVMFAVALSGEGAPAEPHSAALLGSDGYQRLTRQLEKIRCPHNIASHSKSPT